ncbi:MAG: sigma 54-interacting transcriptional regulator [Candidatus Eisenbacteria bacterium]|nr:sigma 54-interacting transcriptional regulator [Candidatus Eisenbacteria bacterium]
MHGLSPRRTGRFVAINCAAIPENLLESEIFGHEKGSFTGATASRSSCFEHAHEGTLFLDEIGDMPAGLQTSSCASSRTDESAGSERDPRDPCRRKGPRGLNVDIASRLASGRLREDLCFRLNVFTLHLPPCGTAPGCPRPP